jgi:hypothetical protein
MPWFEEESDQRSAINHTSDVVKAYYPSHAPKSTTSQEGRPSAPSTITRLRLSMSCCPQHFISCVLTPQLKICGQQSTTSYY